MITLKGCPWCDGYADFDSDSDNTFYLDVRHMDDCPATLASGDSQWSLCFDPAEMGCTEEQAKRRVAEWWNRRAG